MNTQIWAEIRRFKEVERCSISEIARRMNIDRKTVRRALQEEHAIGSKISRIRTSKLDAYKSHITDRLKEYPRMPATALYDEICRMGYDGKMRILWRYTAKIRKKVKETFLRIETLPAEYAQVDWANCGLVRIGAATRKVSCFVMVLSYSRMMYLEFRLSQCFEDFIQCHINAFRFFNGVPRKVLYDNVKTVVLSRLGKEIRLNPKFSEFAGTFLFEPVCCNPGRGNEKGKVESGIKYIRSNFLSSTTVIWPDIQAQAIQWRDMTANVRLHATTRQRPVDRFEQEKPLLMPSPEKEYDASIIRPVSASSQALVRFDGNAYSVPHTKAYTALILKATLNEIIIFDNINKIASHKRSYERAVVVEDPKHYEELLAEKKKAMSSKVKDQFLGLGEPAHTYLDGLIKTELNLPHHIAAIMDYVRLYGKTEILQAMDHALKYKAYGAPYLKNIIIQQRTSRGIQESVPIVVPSKPIWTQICVEEQDLSLYDDLFAAEHPETIPETDSIEQKEHHDKKK